MECSYAQLFDDLKSVGVRVAVVAEYDVDDDVGEVGFVVVVAAGDGGGVDYCKNNYLVDYDVAIQSFWFVFWLLLGAMKIEIVCSFGVVPRFSS